MPFIATAVSVYLQVFMNVLLLVRRRGHSSSGRRNCNGRCLFYGQARWQVSTVLVDGHGRAALVPGLAAVLNAGLGNTAVYLKYWYSIGGHELI